MTRWWGNYGDDTFNIGFDENAALPYRVVIDGGVGRDTVEFTSTQKWAAVKPIWRTSG
ncbi:hypothetical protein PE067_06695 [Paracoccus sp. DMF-8]|uniref:hypothetical protein n=1 Tax=Paracoccus sp. DMF-8 TaxID=3019445 RepID=UPI0023E80977|nr:hypothetical protein [Paracoccus sp. DMF-8]MDF3605864.1 hypothetical protein [Paracoccus sp. DMF-8]